MAVDLKLLPFDITNSERNSPMNCSTVVLDCDTNSKRLFDKISKAVKAEENASNTKMFMENREHEVGKVNTTFLSFCRMVDGEYSYGYTPTDAYLETVKWITVELLLKATRNCAQLNKNYPRNKAAWAYLKALPKGTKIALFWS
jgi:hypothetical protein